MCSSEQPFSCSHEHLPQELVHFSSAQAEESTEGSVLSFFSDEGLDLSQHTLTDTMFVGPELDADGEEVITGMDPFSVPMFHQSISLQRREYLCSTLNKIIEIWVRL